MDIFHTQPNSKKRIRMLPITGNYLVEETSGMLRWAEPNDEWRLYSPTGGQRCLITNIRYDDTEHSSDLWIYSLLSKNEMQLGSDDVAELLFNENRTHVNRARKWYIRQFIPNMERVGVKRFTGLPLNAWRATWRRTIPANDILIYGLSNNQMKIVYAGLNFNTFLKWPEMQTDVKKSDSFMTQDGTQWRVSTTVMPWLHENCQGGFIPFSDYDRMFPDDQDEITYMIDVA